MAPPPFGAFSEASTEVTSWVDAICINQDDMQEKAEQVHRMDTIYKKAREVLVWLGWLDDLPSEVVVVIHVLIWMDLLKRVLRHRRAIGEEYDWDIAKLETCAHHLATNYDISMTNLLAMVRLCHADVLMHNVDGWLKDWLWKDDITPPSHIFWIGLAAFANLEYFRRVWTYQELMLGQVLTIVLGRPSVS